MEQRDALELIRKLADNVESHEVYFNLRLLGLKRISLPTIELVKFCIAIQALGLPITSSLMRAITGKKPDAILRMFHRLGDNNILLLHKFKKDRTLIYTLNPAFRIRLEKNGILTRLQELLKTLIGEEVEVKPSVAA